ncbi:hypothetical protein GCM10029964_048900 [Kibdelosporangium lantanae]
MARSVSASASSVNAASTSMGSPVVSRFLVSAIRRHSRTERFTAFAYSVYAIRRLSSQRVDCVRRQRIRSVVVVATNVAAEPSRTPAMVRICATIGFTHPACHSGLL